MGKLQSKFRRSRSELYKATKGDGEDAAVSQVVQYEPAHRDAVNCVTNLTSDLCVSGGGDMAVVVYDWRGGKLCQSFQGHNREVTKVECFPGSTWIFSASRDKSVMMWDLNQGDEPIQEFCGHELVVNGLAVSPDGSRLCTGSRDNSMCLWDIESGERVHKNTVSRNLLWDLRQPGCKVVEYRGHRETTACCVFLPSSPGGPALVASSSHDCSVKIWDQNTAACLTTLALDGSGPLVSLAPSDSSSLLCASFNTGLHVLHHRTDGLDLKEVARF
ncbi:unnamed protein product [Coregonus sp. 'balchen']|nr:unnamed protein product [Coregonus sp. 'balchen']